MHDLKIKVHNKAKVKSSIADVYILEEISTFCTMYFQTDIPIRHTRPPHNDDGGESSASDQLSIFEHARCAFRRCLTHTLDDRELHAVELYILLNYTEFESYVE